VMIGLLDNSTFVNLSSKGPFSKILEKRS